MIDPTTEAQAVLVEEAQILTADDIAAGPETMSPAASPTRRRTKIPPRIWAAMGWIGFVILIAIVADWLPIKDYSIDVGKGIRTGPFQYLSEPFGTDGLGRSELSRLIYGARVSLQASFAAASIALVIGTIVGMCAGYFRGKVDAVIGVVVDSVLAFPGLMLLLILAAVLGPSVKTVIIGLSAFGWVSFARLTRANTLQVAASDYVAASRGLGAKTRTTLFRDMLPNVIMSVAALAPLVIGYLILAEAGLSFLGLGVRPPTPSWGNMISDARADLRTHTYLMLIPAVVLFLTIFSVNTFGDWLRTRSDAASRL